MVSVKGTKQHAQQQQQYERDEQPSISTASRSHAIDELEGILQTVAKLIQEKKYQEAEQAYKDAIEKFTNSRHFGPLHVATLALQNNLGCMYESQNQHDLAEQMYKQAIVGREQTLGETHQDTLSSVNNLAGLYMFQKKLNEAHSIYTRALVSTEKVYGESSQEALYYVGCLADCEFAQRRDAEAKRLCDRLIEKSKEMRAAHPHMLLNCYANAATIAKDQGHYEEAEGHLAAAIDLCRTVLGPEHSKTVHRIVSLGLVLDHQDRYDEARSKYQEALDILKKNAQLAQQEAKLVQILNTKIRDCDRRKMWNQIQSRSCGCLPRWSLKRVHAMTTSEASSHSVSAKKQSAHPSHH